MVVIKLAFRGGKTSLGSVMSALFEWPLRCFPVIERAGWVPFSKRSMLREYQHPTVALHQHDYAGQVMIGPHVFQLQPGDVTITPPEMVSRYELQNAGSHRYIHFRPEKGRPKACFQLPLHIKREALLDREEVGRRMRAVAEWSELCGGRHEELSRLAGGLLLQELLLYLTRQRPPLGKRTSRSEASLDRIKEQIERDYPKDLRVRDLVIASGLSQNYFARRFRERFGVTVEAYLLRRRIEAAKLYLATSDLSVKEVAFECGIPDPNYFNKQFRRLVGENPSQFRARARSPKW